MEFHNLLNKQIKKLLPEKYQEDLIIQDFLECVSNSYKTFERSNQITEHAFTIREREYQEINNSLILQNQINQKIKF